MQKRQNITGSSADITNWQLGDITGSAKTLTYTAAATSLRRLISHAWQIWISSRRARRATLGPGPEGPWKARAGIADLPRMTRAFGPSEKETRPESTEEERRKKDLSELWIARQNLMKHRKV